MQPWRLHIAASLYQTPPPSRPSAGRMGDWIEDGYVSLTTGSCTWKIRRWGTRNRRVLLARSDILRGGSGVHELTVGALPACDESLNSRLQPPPPIIPAYTLIPNLATPLPSPAPPPPTTVGTTRKGHWKEPYQLPSTHYTIVVGNSGFRQGTEV